MKLSQQRALKFSLCRVSLSTAPIVFSDNTIVFSKADEQVQTFGYLIDDEIAFVNARSGLLLEDAQQLLIDSKPKVLILGNGRQSSYLIPGLSAALGENSKIYLVDIGTCFGDKIQ